MNDYKTIYDAIISGKGVGGNSMFNPKFGIIEPEYLYLADYQHWDSSMDSYDNVSEDTVIPFSQFNSISSDEDLNYVCLYKADRLQDKIYEIIGCDYGTTHDHCIGMIDFSNSLFILELNPSSNKDLYGAIRIAGNSNDFRYVTHTINGEQYLMIDVNAY